MKIKAQYLCKNELCNWTDLKYFVHDNCFNCLRHEIACIIYPTELYKQSGLLGRLTEPATMVYQVQPPAEEDHSIQQQQQEEEEEMRGRKERRNGRKKERRK